MSLTLEKGRFRLCLIIDAGWQVVVIFAVCCLANVYFALRGDDWTDEQKAEIESLPFRYLVLLQKM